MSLLMPDRMLPGLLNLSVKKLTEWKIKGILLDVDNTMTSHGNPEPLEGVLEWSKEIRAAGIQLIIVSNNTRERVDAFAGLFGLPYISRGLKPLPFGFFRARKRMGLRRREVAAVGDQIFTDVLGAHLAGVKAILLTPVQPERSRSFRIRRHFEKGLIRRYHNRSGEGKK